MSCRTRSGFSNIINERVSRCSLRILWQAQLVMQPYNSIADGGKVLISHEGGEFSRVK